MRSGISSIRNPAAQVNSILLRVSSRAPTRTDAGSCESPGELSPFDLAPRVGSAGDFASAGTEPGQQLARVVVGACAYHPPFSIQGKPVRSFPRERRSSD